MLGCQVHATTPSLCFQTSYIWLNPPRYIGCHNFDCNVVLSDTNFTKNNFYSLMCYLISGNVEGVRKINGNFSQSSQNVNIHGTGVLVEGICSLLFMRLKHNVVDRYWRNVGSNWNCVCVVFCWTYTVFYSKQRRCPQRFPTKGQIICLSYDTKDSSHSLHAVPFIFTFLCACLFMCACTLRTFSSTWICACWHWVSSSTAPHLTFWRYSFIVLGAQCLSKQVG